MAHAIAPTCVDHCATTLETRERSRRGRADAAGRARVILLLAHGDSYGSITAKTGCSSRTIALWKRRFEADGVAGMTAGTAVRSPRC